MSPPISLSACPPQIRAHPLPGDQCTDPRAPVHPPERRFRQLSAVLELPSFGLRSGSPSGVDFRYRSGAYALFRPVPEFHIGAGLDTDWASELTVMGRVGSNIPFHPLRMYGMSLTGLAGLRQVFGQSHEIGGVDTAVSGPLFSVGTEVSLRFQMWNEFSFVLPYFRFLASPSMELGNSAGGRVQVPWSWQMQFGLGLSFDFLSAGN